MIRVHPMFNEAILTLAWFAAINVAVSIAVLIAARFFGDTVGANPARARRLALARLAPSVIGGDLDEASEDFAVPPILLDVVLDREEVDDDEGPSEERPDR